MRPDLWAVFPCCFFAVRRLGRHRRSRPTQMFRGRPTNTATRPSRVASISSNSSTIELLEIPVNPPLAERDPPLGGEICGNARARGHPIMQGDDARDLALEPPHPLGEGIAQSLDDLEQGEIHVTKPAAEEIRAAALF